MALKDAQARGAGHGQLYLDLTVTDAPYSNPRFILGGQRFLSTNAFGGAPVSPVVLSWGDFQGGSSPGISDEAGGRIVLDANAWLVQANGTQHGKVSSWLAQINWRETPCTLYQWNAYESAQEAVWSGYVLGVTESRFVKGVYQVELMLSATTRDMETTDISDLITEAAFSSAPTGSLGKMVPRVYGRADNILSTTDVGGGLAKVGFPMPGIRGIIIDESQATAKVKVRFGKNDGSFSWHTFPTGTSDNPNTNGGLWVYDQGMGCYGMVDPASYTVTNDVDKCEVLVDATPKVFFFIRPKQIGSTNAAGFTDSHKILDSDPNNYVVSDAVGNHSWAFYLPSVSFPGRVKSIGMIADWYNAHATKNRQISLGVWDIYNGTFGAAASPNWLHGGLRLRTVTKVPGDPRIITMQDTAAFRYEQSNFTNHTGNDTNGEFTSGSFVTKDAGDTNQATLELRVFVEDLGGANSGRESVQLYNVGMVVEVDYVPSLTPMRPHAVQDPWNAVWEGKEAVERYAIQSKIEAERLRGESLRAIVGTDFFARGAAQKDDGSGTYTGTASSCIERPQDIAHHILAEVIGQSVNTTAGTLGNFVDPRSNGVLKDLKVLEPFGPDVVKRGASLRRLCQRFPISLRRKAGNVWHCIPDDLNPHSSAVYRSTSEPIWIEKNDFDQDSFTDRELDISEMVNSVILNYSHGYPDREAMASTTYENHLSQKWFGKKATDPYEYPEIQQNDVSAAVDQKATDMAQWLGRRTARPRRIVTAALPQKFYDLEPGHCLGFKGLEDIGIPVQAYRAGLADYHFNSAAGGTDYADSNAAVLISLTSTTALIGLSQQTDHLIWSIATAAAYTPVANAWRYSSASGFSNFGSIVNTNVLQSTGVNTVSWALPNWWEWIKTEQTLGGTTYGPCYWIQFNYSAPTVAGLASLRVSYAARWLGRYFKVLSVKRRPGRTSRDYPYKDAVLLEVA